MSNSSQWGIRQFKGFSLGLRMALVSSALLSGAFLLFLVIPHPTFLALSSGRSSIILHWVLSMIVTAGVIMACTSFFVDRPLRKLKTILDESPKKGFLPRAPIQGADVVAQFSKSFNQLLEHITKMDASQLETERELQMSQEIETRWKELSLLHDFSQELSATLEIDELYRIVETLVSEKLDVQEFALLVMDEVLGCLKVELTHGFTEEQNKRIAGMTFQPDEGVTGRVLRNRDNPEPIYIPDTSKEPHYLYYKGERHGDGSFLVIPLIHRKQLMGTLNLFRPHKNGFHPEEVHFLSTLSVALAISLANARLYSKTRELSVRDELTDAFNRRYFHQTLPREIKRAKRFDKSVVLLMMDMDYFKSINDQHGHLVGDQILMELVKFITARIREVDFLARYGGEEFVLILPNTSQEDGLMVAEKVRRLVSEHIFGIHHVSGGLRLTLSIGLSIYPFGHEVEDDQEVEALIDAADVALYEAKRKGRNCVVLAKNNVKQNTDASQDEENTLSVSSHEPIIRIP